MAGLRSRLAAIAGVTALAASALVIPLAAPVTALTAAGTLGCDFGMFPTAPGGQSGARFSCNFTPYNGRAVQTYHDFPTAVWHNGAARTVSATVATTKTLTATNGRFTAADINHTVSGVGIAPYTFITAVASATSVTLNKVGTAAGTGVAVKVENSDVRSVNDGVTSITQGAKTTITSLTANFVAGDVGKSIGGTNIPVGATITARNSATSVTISAEAIAAGTGQVITIGATQLVSSTREINDAVVVASAGTGTAAQKKTITSATANFVSSDVGLPVTMPTAGTLAGCIPAGSYIVTVNSTTSITLNQATSGCASPNLSGRRVVIGDPTVTAPADGNGMANLASALVLNPALVAGQPACSTNTVYGTSLSGSWYNPGAYLTATRPTGASIGQIAFRTAVVNFAAYIVPVNASTSGDPQAEAHFDIAFPGLPTGLAACPGTATSASVSFAGSTDSSSNVATGVGRPSTSLRGLARPSATEVTTKAYYTAGAIPAYGANSSVSGYTPGSAAQSFSGDCVVKQVATFGYPCGN